jgi:putative FmdB family regulatory protein
MPIYEYQCKACGHEFEREQRITEDPIKKCPSCAAPQARRLISRTSFVLKGGGWYSDLYSSSKTPAKESGGGDAAKGDAAKGDAAKGDKSKSGSEKTDAPKPSPTKDSKSGGSSSARGKGGAQAAA